MRWPARNVLIVHFPLECYLFSSIFPSRLIFRCMHECGYSVFRSHFDWLILGLYTSLPAVNIPLAFPPKDIMQIASYGNGASRLWNSPCFCPSLPAMCEAIRRVKAWYFSARQTDVQPSLLSLVLLTSNLFDLVVGVCTLCLSLHQ